MALFKRQGNIKEGIENNSQNKQTKFSWKVVGIFVLGIILICGFVFISNYNIAYDDDAEGGWLPPSFAIKFYYFVLVILFIIAAIVLKIVFKKRVRFWTLLLASVFIPIICYNFNYHTLKKDGPNHYLVDKGGIFHFIANGDYNFDGVNDERYHLLYDEREYSMRYGGDYYDVKVDYIQTRAIGTGTTLDNTFSFYDCVDSVIDLHLDKNRVTFKEIKITVAFKETGFAETVSFYLDNKELKANKVSDKIVELVFDATTCAEWQKNADNENIKIPIKYEFNN